MQGRDTAPKEMIGMEYQFEKLEVWQRGMDLTEKIYKVTRVFPSEERFGITSQLQRAAVSIPLNIAEGKGRYHSKVFTQFLYQARGSLYEVITLLKISLRLQYLGEGEARDLLGLCNETVAKINNLVKVVKK